MARPLSLRSSGDSRADGRYEYARAAFEAKDFAGAADLARQVLERAPDFAAAHALLGRSLAAAGRPDEAVPSLERARQLEPDDELGVRLDLARLGALSADAAITDGYVRTLFDNYAADFDHHLTHALGYCGPDLIMAALGRACSLIGRALQFDRVVDLGCGTGLMGAALAAHSGRIEGVDLSPRMLAKAHSTGHYHALHEGGLTPYLKQLEDAAADLVVAADVLIYLSDLQDVFVQSHRALRPGGLFAYTVQAHEGSGTILGQDGRYAHSRPDLSALAEKAGFETMVFDEASVRRDRDVPVPGFIAILRRPL